MNLIFGDTECGDWEDPWDNKTFATSVDSDRLSHSHESGRYNLHVDCSI